MDHGYLADPAAITSSHQLFHNQNLTVSEPGSQQASVMSSSDPKWHSGSNTEGTDMVITEEALSNGTCDLETVIDSHCVSSSGDVLGIGDLLALSNDGISEISNSDLSLPEVCISTNSTSFEEDMNYEVQQAYRIFTGFLLDKHKAITSPFLNPIGHLEAQHGIGGVRGRGQAQLKQSMCLRRMEEKFVSREYETITEFVADFRLMLENCYRYHGVDHWISKQAQKLEIMLEQKLTLLSRTLREKTTLAVTSKGRFGAEEERGSGGTSTRRRSAPRSLATLTVGGHESIMVQALRVEEQQRAKEEKRQRELDKKEAEEMSAKEVEEWERNLLSQASPHHLETLWELPAIGHLLCLAQTALNLPEIVFFELERCLLMPRCSPFLSKVMSALLCPPQRRATLNRRPSLPYRRWESELRQRVQGWYRIVGASHDQPARAEQLGLCHQFFSTLGEVNPLEETPFHLLPFYQRVWLLKGLCENVYETQKDVQGAVLAQPIHECRESILGYDSMENAYIHFPHFCGADLRIYCQSPSMPPSFPLPPVWVKRIEPELGTEATEDEGSDGTKPKKIKKCYGESDDSGNEGEEKRMDFKRENGGTELNSERFNSWPLKDEEGSDTETSDDSSEDSKSNLKMLNNSLFFPTHLENSNRGKSLRLNFKEESQDLEHQPSTLTVKQELSFSLDSGRTIKAETWEPCLSVGEHSYTGRSPARSENLASPGKVTEVKMGGDSPNQGHKVSSCLECSRHNTALKSEEHVCCCSTSVLAPRSSCESAQNSSEEKANDRMRSRKKKRKKGRGREQLLRVKGGNRQLQQPDEVRQCQSQAAKSSMQRSASTIKRKDERKQPKTGKKLESSKKVKEESPVEPSFKLVCTGLEELRRLISKTEDELDSLESTKKRAGRWYFNKESVKELHITLIRLLNELSPWEPKLVKAYQRNRLRLKKEFDDFRKHSDYNNFVREECVSSSSEEDEDNSIGGEVCSLPDHYRRAEEDDHGVPRSLWTGGALKQFEGQSNDSLMTSVTANHLKRSFSSTDEDLTLRQRNHTNMTTLPHSVLEPRSGLNRTDQDREGYSTLATASATQASLGSRSIILHPTIGLPKGYTPIPTLLAKSVGNKVTLMKRPADYLGVSSNVGQSKVQVMTQPSLMGAASECTRAQSSQSQPEQSFQQLHSQGPQKTRVHKRIIATATTTLPKSPQAKPSHATLPKSPVQVVYKAPEGLGHLLKKDDNSQVKISVQSIMDQNTGEKRMQQVVILPSSLLIQKTEETLSSQQLHKSTQAPFSKVAGRLCMTTNVPGFTIPDSRIPVQQVAPLKDARAVRNSSPSVSPHLQQNPLNTASLKVAQASSTQGNAPQTIVQNWSLATSPTSAVSTESSRPTNPKQELKTVCIRDSQSILVTTRGGNTGIVKVQTSSDQNAPGSLPPSPIITISPQFKAFLVSQTSPPCSLSAPSQTSSCTFPAGLKLSEVQPQQQVHSVTSSSTVTAPRPALVTGTIPLVGLRSQTSGSTVTFCHGDNLSPGPMVVSQSGQKVVTTTSGSQFPAPLVKNTVIVPSLSGSGNPLATTPAQCKLGVKCASTDERSQLTKLILVAPSSSSSSSSSSNAALHKVTSSSTTSLPCSRFVFISQSAGATTTTTTSMGCIAKQGLVAGAGGQPLTTSIPSEPVKMGISLGQPVSSNHSEVQSITLPTGVQIRLPGRTVSLGHAGGALPQSPKSTAVSISMTGSQAATAGMALVQSSNMVTSTSTSSHVQGVSSFTTVPQPSPPRSMAAVVTPPPGCVIKKDPSLSKGVFATNPSAQVTTTAQMNPGKTTMPTLVHQSKNVLSVPTPATPSIVPRTPASTLKRASITGSTNPFSTSTIPSTTTAASTMQQRIVINTTTPLAAGTQILLNNTRFVVPPQGLGPGSHVLLISSPVTPPVPITSTTTTTPVKALLQGPSPMTDASRRPVIPASPPGRLPNTPALGSSVVVGASATGPTVLITTPTVTPLRLAGTPALSSPLRGATNVVSALPRLPAPQGLASLVSGTPTLVSALPLLASTSTLISPVLTSAPDLTSVLPAVQLPAGTSTLAQCSPHTATLSALAVLPRLTAPPLSSPILPTTSAVASISPGTSTLAPLSSAELAGLPPAPATQQTVSVGTLSPGFPHQLKTLTLPASSTAMNVIRQASLHTGPTNTSIKHQVATVMQPILACTRTQLLPTVAVPPIASTASRMQSLPIATVTPIGSTLNSLQASPVAIVPPSNTTVLMTPVQPNRELKTHEPVCTPIFLTNKALGKPSLQNSASAVHATIGSKLLISPDGAVLNTVQGPVNPASMPVITPKPLATLVVSASSSSGRALPTTCTNNSTVQSAEGDISEPMN